MCATHSYDGQIGLSLHIYSSLTRTRKALHGGDFPPKTRPCDGLSGMVFVWLMQKRVWMDGKASSKAHLRRGVCLEGVNQVSWRVLGWMGFRWTEKETEMIARMFRNTRTEWKIR